ncbi:MAG TPA: O-antigen ligase family protein [Cytophagaceae bacterium]|nr:O-antigen ligase family protein [Cytophagaceae bacterium]
MNILFKQYSEYIALSLLMILLAFLATFLDESFYSVLIIGIPVLLFLLLTLFKDYKKILFLLILAIPLSVPLTLDNGFTLLFPSEILLAFLALYVGVRFVFFYPIDKKILFHPVSILILLDLFWNMVCSINSASLEVSFKRTIVSIAYILIYYFLLTELFSNTQNISKVYKLYILGLVIPIAYTLYMHAEFDFAVSDSPQISRPFYNDHTIYGAVLAFFIPYLIYSTVKKQDNLNYTIVYGLLSLLFLVGLYFSFSRAAWLSLLIAGLFFIFTLLKHKLIVSFVLLILIIVNASFLWKTIYETAIESKAISNKENITEHVQSVTNISSDVSNAERINRWKSALRMFYDRPLMGFGPGTYQFYYGNYQLRTEMTRISTYKGDRGHAHSEYLNKLSETGWPGLLLFISTGISVFLVAWRIDKITSDSTTKNLVRITAMALLTFYIHSFFNGFIETDKMAMPVYAAIAAIVAIDIKLRDKKINR